MSELINARSTSTRWHLLTTVSSLTLLSSVMGTLEATAAEDSDRPLVWIELGGQMESQTGQGDPFIPDFALNKPTAPGVQGFNFQAQKPSALSTGFEGALTFQPSGSEWVFSATVRYGRANRSRSAAHSVEQRLTSKFLTLTRMPTESGGVQYNFHCCSTVTGPAPGNPYTDLKSRSEQTHTVVDFEAGKDVGLGLFGSKGSSVINVGVRFAQFASKSSATFHGRPTHEFYHYNHYYAGYEFYFNYAYPSHRYAVTLNSARNFRGVGPSISWNASAPVLGNPEAGEVDLDWGVNAAVLFGRQQASGSHHTLSLYRANYATSTQQRTMAFDRKRSMVVPNLGGYAGLSFRFTNAKLSLGYRGDFFFGAMDAGNDIRRTKAVDFYGPFAGVSIGLGG